MTKPGFPIGTIRSNVDTEDGDGIVFSRDCPEYQVRTQGGADVFVLVNHFKSQSGGGGDRRLRQAREVRRIADGLIDVGNHVVVLGDLDEGPTTESSQAANLSPLFDNNSPLVDSYSPPAFDVGPRPGTFDSCGLRNRLDYILISRSLVNAFNGGAIFREGLWGTRKTRPTAWATYPDMQNGDQQASDHAASSRSPRCCARRSRVCDRSFHAPPTTSSKLAPSARLSACFARSKVGKTEIDHWAFTPRYPRMGSWTGVRLGRSPARIPTS
jgi:hypothetical protein